MFPGVFQYLMLCLYKKTGVRCQYYRSFRKDEFQGRDTYPFNPLLPLPRHVVLPQAAGGFVGDGVFDKSASRKILKMVRAPKRGFGRRGFGVEEIDTWMMGVWTYISSPSWDQTDFPPPSQHHPLVQ